MPERFLGSHTGARLVRAAIAIECVDEVDLAKPGRAESLRTAINAMVAILTNLPVEMPPSEKRREGYITAANLLARSSIKQRLPDWLLPLVEKPEKR
jgi:hypothetical protein